MNKAEHRVKPLSNRRIDQALFYFFISHIPITMCVDLIPIYPEWLIPNVLSQLNQLYVDIAGDPFMNRSGPVMYWFKSILFCEAFLQLPFFFFAAYGVYHDKKWIRLPLAVYGAHVATTVVPCLTEIYFNNQHGLVNIQIFGLMGLYFPYLLMPLIALVDSCIRLTYIL